MPLVDPSIWRDGSKDPSPAWAYDFVGVLAKEYGIVRPRLRFIDKSGWGGEYVPQVNAIVIISHPNIEIEHGLLAHESGHWILDRKPALRGQSVRGAHDDGFYRFVETVYRKHGVRPSVAVRVERGRSYPKRWEKLTTW